MDPDKIEPIHEALAAEIAREAVDGYAHLLTEDERELIQFVLETDLLFDPTYANMMRLAAIDSALPNSSGVQRSGVSAGVSDAVMNRPAPVKTSKR